MKTCNMCMKELSFDNFYKRSNSDKVLATCKQCISYKNKANIESRRVNYINFIKKYDNYKKEYRQKHVEKCREYGRKHYIKNKEIIIARNIDSRKNNIKRKLSSSLRERLNCAIRNNQKFGSAVRDLGCSIDEFKKYIESLWQPGMSWDNWSKYGWHIDHIVPLSSFDLSDPEQLKKACHYTNLQPLWWQDNLAKNSKVLKKAGK